MGEENAGCATYVGGDVVLSSAISSPDLVSIVPPALNYTTVEDYPEAEGTFSCSTDEAMAWPDSFFPGAPANGSQGGLELSRPSPGLNDNLSNDSGSRGAGPSEDAEMHEPKTTTSGRRHTAHLIVSALKENRHSIMPQESSSTSIRKRPAVLYLSPTQVIFGRAIEKGEHTIPKFQASNNPSCPGSLQINIHSLVRYIACTNPENFTKYLDLHPSERLWFREYEQQILSHYVGDISSFPIILQPAFIPGGPLGEETFLSHEEFKRTSLLFPPYPKRGRGSGIRPVDGMSVTGSRFGVRRLRSNPDYLRRSTLELNMKRRNPKAERPLRSREVLMPRLTLYRPSRFLGEDFRSATRKRNIPRRWVAVSVE